MRLSIAGMLLFMVAPERPWPAIIMHFSAEMNIVAHETCNWSLQLQKSSTSVVTDRRPGGVFDREAK
jgi:hypothetical protein